ncbi:MAG: hypothetical protein RL020_667 [Pseudomonadota bacterium]
MNLKIVAVSMLTVGVMMTGLLSTSSAEAQKTEQPIANIEHFTADEQRAASQSARAAAVQPMTLAEAPQPANAMTVTPSASITGEPATWSVPAAIWLAASGLAGMGLLQRRRK